MKISKDSVDGFVQAVIEQQLESFLVASEAVRETLYMTDSKSIKKVYVDRLVDEMLHKFGVSGTSGFELQYDDVQDVIKAIQCKMSEVRDIISFLLRHAVKPKRLQAVLDELNNHEEELIKQLKGGKEYLAKVHDQSPKPGVAIH